METFFLKIVNLSITASYLVLALVLLRPWLKRLPRWLTAALWVMVALRLLLPWSLESVLSLIPSTQTLPQDFTYAAQPQIQSGIEAVDAVVNPALSQSMAPGPVASANPSQIWSFIFSWAWAVGVGLMGLYAIVSWGALKLRMRTAVILRDGILQSERVVSPFVLGFFRPVIYLPFRVGEQDLEHVIAHERAHIRRRDHWWKPIGFALLAVHWFNPLMWLAYILFCRDIEAACDEKVVSKLDHSQRQAYSTALLNCAVHHRAIAACPLAFGEVGVKERVKSVMHYKKPTFWLILAGGIICAVVAVCFLTDPINASVVNPSVQEYIPGQGNILGSVDKAYYESKSPDFAIGADKYGRAVFKDPHRAFDTFTELYSGAIDRIRQENDLAPISRANYSLYKKLGWQMTSGTEEEQEAARFVTKFLDIYENSFTKTPPNTAYEAPITEEPRALSLNDVIILSQKGYELSWEDFEGYEHTEGGFGLWIFIYRINSLYRLSIGDAKLEGDPMYIYLTHIPTGDQIDIRDGGVTDFLSAHGHTNSGLVCVDIISRYSLTCLSAPEEISYVLTFLEGIRDDLEPVRDPAEAGDVINDSWNYVSFVFNYPDVPREVMISKDATLLWTGEGESLSVFSVNESGPLRDFLSSIADGVKGENASGTPFATVEEPWEWTKHIHSGAVSQAWVYIKHDSWREGDTVFSSASSGYFASDRFAQLLSVLNEIPESAFSKGKVTHNCSFSLLRTDTGGTGAVVTIIDPVNSLAVAIRYCEVWDTVEIILTGELEKALDGDSYLEPMQRWVIQDQKLKGALLEIMDYPPVVTYFVGSDYEWSDPVELDNGIGKLSLRIAQGWEYEIVEQETNFGIRCRPQTEETGWIYFSFWPMGYEPSESDRYYLEGTDSGYPTIRSYPSQVGTQNGVDLEGAVWSFYKVSMEFFDFAVINDRADAWFEEYDAVIDAALSLCEFSISPSLPTVRYRESTERLRLRSRLLLWEDGSELSFGTALKDSCSIDQIIIRGVSQAGTAQITDASSIEELLDYFADVKGTDSTLEEDPPEHALQISFYREGKEELTLWFGEPGSDHCWVAVGKQYLRYLLTGRTSEEILSYLTSFIE